MLELGRFVGAEELLGAAGWQHVASHAQQILLAFGPALARLHRQPAKPVEDAALGEHSASGLV